MKCGKGLINRHSIWLGLWLAVAGIWLSCEQDSVIPETETSEPEVGLAIQVHSASLVKGQVEGYYSDGSRIGVFLRASDGTRYNGQMYDNIFYMASGSDANQTWSVDADHPISLSITKGSAYAYYPWQAEVGSLNEITFMNDGTDWMYTPTPATNLSIKHPIAQLDMVHAMTIIRCHIQKGAYEGSGVLRGISVAGAGLAYGAKLDLQTGTFSTHLHVGADIYKVLSSSLGAGTVTEELWAFPMGTECTLQFKLRIDEHTFVVHSAPLTLYAGYVHDFTLTVDGETIQLSEVAVSDWHESANQDVPSTFDPTDHALDWEVAKAVNGVYAITDDGRALPAEYASGSSYAGAAYVLQGKAYEVAPTEPAGVNANQEVYWHQTEYFDIETIPNYLTVDGNFERGYIDGIHEPMIAIIPADWHYGALSDLAGAENTAAIITAQSVEGVPLVNTISEALLAYRAAVGQEAWFIPAFGQLSYMMYHYQEINSILGKVEGAQPIAEAMYWSSSERLGSSVWIYNSSDHGLSFDWKIDSLRVRLIREL